MEHKTYQILYCFCTIIIIKQYLRTTILLDESINQAYEA